MILCHLALWPKRSTSSHTGMELAAPLTPTARLLAMLAMCRASWALRPLAVLARK